MGLKEKEKIKGGEEDSESGSTIEKRHARLMRDGGGRNKGCGINVAKTDALAVNSVGKSGGLAMLWKDGIKVDIQNYSRHHIDSVIQLEDQRSFRFIGFYGHADLNQRNDSWNMLKRVGGMVNEIWIVGGDFNAIVNRAEKEGRCRSLKL
ncbi:hypothetical protein GOBAR_DD13158 [Gossypium barbadense]|nr:hypothetical protein GOBAR_DD13158 [Gossypium barbadense]